MESFFSNIEYILEGLGLTVLLWGLTVIVSIPIGIIGAIGKVSGGKIVRSILSFYTWIFRGTPLVLQIFFIYYGLPILSKSLKIADPFNAALLTFILNYGAYFIEIFRGGIESIDKGQYEASKAMGFSYSQTMLHIILPQTIRRVIPTTCSEIVNLVKDTALVSVIALRELSRAAKELVSSKLIISPFVIAAIIYLLLNSITMFIFKRLEEKYKKYE